MDTATNGGGGFSGEGEGTRLTTGSADGPLRGQPLSLRVREQGQTTYGSRRDIQCAAAGLGKDRSIIRCEARRRVRRRPCASSVGRIVQGWCAEDAYYAHPDRPRLRRSAVDLRGHLGDCGCREVWGLDEVRRILAWGERC